MRVRSADRVEERVDLHGEQDNTHDDGSNPKWVLVRSRMITGHLSELVVWHGGSAVRKRSVPDI
jgi:hypothetical protein